MNVKKVEKASNPPLRAMVHRQQPQSVFHQMRKLPGARETGKIVEGTDGIWYNRGAL